MRNWIQLVENITPAKAMVEAFRAKFARTRLTGKVSVSLEVTGSNDVELEYINTDSLYRRKHLATKAMKLLTACADQYRVRLTLYIDPDAGADEDSPDADALSQWYANFGFTDQDYWTHMVREPF